MMPIQVILQEEIAKVDPDKIIAGCLMLDMNKKIGNWDDVMKIIDPADVYNDATNDYGVEKEPHITILFGFDKAITGEQMKEHLSDLRQNIKFSLLGITCFEGGENKPFDVVKFDIDSPDLVALNARVKKEIPNQVTFPVYHPHLTIAYVKSGTGKKYVKKFSEPQPMESNALLYSVGGKNGKTKTSWKISKKYKFNVEINEPKND